jgi:hypothetical protein
MSNGRWFAVALFLAGALVSGASVVLYGDYVGRAELVAVDEKAEQRFKDTRTEFYTYQRMMAEQHETERDVREELLVNQADMKAKMDDLIEEVRRLRNALR